MTSKQLDCDRRAKASAGVVRMDVASSPKALPVVRAAVGRVAEAEGFSENEVQSIVWAIDEALANVIRHGYENRNDQRIFLTLEPARAPDGRTGLRASIRDHGRQVEPGKIKGRDLDDVRPGGLGVHVIRSVMDDVAYSCPSDGGMLLRMTKYLTAGAVDAAPSTTKAADHDK
ncbi:MAG: ATP-binding protein [Phycisphaerae bacterium]